MTWRPNDERGDWLFQEQWRRFGLACDAFAALDRREHTVQSIAHAATVAAWYSERDGMDAALRRIGD